MKTFTILIWTLLGGITPVIHTNGKGFQASAFSDTVEAKIVWPTPDMSFSAGLFIKIKTAPVGSNQIRAVQFFANTNLIGTVTNAPFNLIWRISQGGQLYGSWNLTTIVRDIQGLVRTSAPVKIFFYTGGPPLPIVEIAGPESGKMFAAPAGFQFSAELLASVQDAGPVEFFLGADSLGTVGDSSEFSEATSHYSITVTNLMEGIYDLSVRYLGANGIYCSCNGSTNVIRVVKLGINAPHLSLEGAVRFDVITSFPGKETKIEASTDLTNWLSISTNIPSTNVYQFTSPISNIPERWYRASIPTE